MPWPFAGGSARVAPQSDDARVADDAYVAAHTDELEALFTELLTDTLLIQIPSKFRHLRDWDTSPDMDTPERTLDSSTPKLHTSAAFPSWAPERVTSGAIYAGVPCTEVIVLPS